MTMPTLFRTAFFLFGFVRLLHAQTSAQDVVILNSQRSYSGIVIEQKPGDYIRLLRLPEHDTLSFPMDSIDRIVKIVPTDKPADNQPAPLKPQTEYNRKRQTVMIHGYMGGGNYSFGGFGITLAQRIGKRWQVGVGGHYIGQKGSYPGTLPDQQIVPVTVDCRWRFSQSATGKTAILLALNTGYNFMLNKEYIDGGQHVNGRITNGLFFNPSFAFRVNLWENAGLMLDLGYQLTSSRLYDLGTDLRIGKRQWHNFAARGTLFF